MKWVFSGRQWQAGRRQWNLGLMAPVWAKSNSPGMRRSHVLPYAGHVLAL